MPAIRSLIDSITAYPREDGRIALGLQGKPANILMIASGMKLAAPLQEEARFKW